MAVSFVGLHVLCSGSGIGELEFGFTMVSLLASIHHLILCCFLACSIFCSYMFSSFPFSLIPFSMPIILFMSPLVCSSLHFIPSFLCSSLPNSLFLSCIYSILSLLHYQCLIIPFISPFVHSACQKSFPQSPLFPDELVACLMYAILLPGELITCFIFACNSIPKWVSFFLYAILFPSELVTCFIFEILFPGELVFCLIYAILFKGELVTPFIFKILIPGELVICFIYAVHPSLHFLALSFFAVFSSQRRPAWQQTPHDPQTHPREHLHRGRRPPAAATCITDRWNDGANRTCNARRREDGQGSASAHLAGRRPSEGGRTFRTCQSDCCHRVAVSLVLCLVFGYTCDRL